MNPFWSRRAFSSFIGGATLGGLAASTASPLRAQEGETKPAGPREAAFERDYEPPKFPLSWKKEQLNRTMLQDFVLFAHSDLDMVKKLLDKEPKLLNGFMDWGGGDWESALGGASHMGRKDVVQYLLERGARIDIFCAAMMGLLEVVQSFLTLQPNLIDAVGPHKFTLHFHAQVGGEESQKVLDYLQSVKKIDLPPNPFLKK